MNYSEKELIKQYKEVAQTGLRTVKCPICGTEAKTEVDNEYIYCEKCDKRVKVGRII